MAQTFGDCWRGVRLHAPGAPALLCQRWVLDTYRGLVDQRGWGWLTKEAQIVFLASRTLAVTVTQGSDLVASAGLFVASDETRTFSVGTYPLYQIRRVISANQIQLTMPFYGTGAGAVSGYIQDAFATLPSRFGRFVVVVDPINQRIVPWWATQQEIDLLDPTRTAVEAVPRMLASAQVSPLPQFPGQMQYEYWPKPSAAGALQYYYIQRPLPLQDDDLFAGVLRDRTDVLEHGALSRCALWPGTKEAPNPYFSLPLAKYHQDAFHAGALQLDLRDDDQMQQSWDTIPWQRWSAWAWAYDTRLLQSTDATIGDYFGGGIWSGMF